MANKKINSVLITGGSSLLGQSIVTALTQAGFSVYSPGSSELDLTSQNSCEQYIKKHNQFDILINVAGISPSGPIDGFSTADLEKTLMVNTIGPFRLMSLVLPHMIRKKSGRIINIASLSALVAFPRFSVYSASKFALRAIGLSAYHELAPKGVYITTVCPGALASSKEISPASARGRIPLIKWLLPLTPPQAVTRTIIDLLSQSRPPAQVLIGLDTQLLVFLNRYLPAFIWQQLQRLVWQKQQ